MPSWLSRTAFYKQTRPCTWTGFVDGPSRTALQSLRKVVRFFLIGRTAKHMQTMRNQIVNGIVSVVSIVLSDCSESISCGAKALAQSRWSHCRLKTKSGFRRTTKKKNVSPVCRKLCEAGQRHCRVPLTPSLRMPSMDSLPMSGLGVSGLSSCTSRAHSSALRPLWKRHNRHKFDLDSTSPRREKTPKPAAQSESRSATKARFGCALPASTWARSARRSLLMLEA
jgi:hypothetical protein